MKRIGILVGCFAAWMALAQEGDPENIRVIYPKHTDLDFEGTDVDGELKRPAELYFQHRPAERFDSLLKRRKEFHRAMLRDVMHE